MTRPTDDELEAIAARVDAYKAAAREADRILSEKTKERPMGPVTYDMGELPEMEDPDQLIADLAIMLRAVQGADDLARQSN
ncbi:hypothetical protein [Roseicitreum antarcticum]|uniref:Uncharacterized protein n=1 Tax=Roseicitreum antarcticum TaxID=564137 RepID=A0A1H2WBF0_9RHOB|nr:hypothetical protein [Roseicitreum antarcticum]SDW77359.1 hypothetical protein SAMN04488238_103314 [Roseicitreum antarcticum]